ncbi:right-handed parallel beta-helix repeat-containing protein [Novipirellula sp. SH528]|uniref:right-handed parallel beta-helix repeat-containing protein n=1 Tax=Novipirellula sp. SH528 TaxID=3454466 RepID=UPI003FA020B4
MNRKFFPYLLLAVFAVGHVSLFAKDKPPQDAGNTPSGDGFHIYVSADAAAKGNGTASAPFQSLNQARDGIRAARKSGILKSDQSVTVEIAPGVYRLNASFHLTAEDGGTAEAPVVYRATKPGSVRIRGSVELSPSKFTAVSDGAVRSRLDETVRDKILVCDVSKIVPGAFTPFKTSFRGVPVAPWLYVNRHPKPLARWPNLDTPEQGWASFSKAIDTGLAEPDSADPTLRKARGGSFEFDDSRPARWNLDAGVWLLGYWTHDWYDEVIRIDSYDQANQVIKLAAPHNYGIKAGTWGAAKRRFFAFNTLEELDTPGEWYLDRSAGKLYYYPESDFADASIELATINQPLIKVEDTKHVKVQGLALEYGHGDGIHLKRTQSIEIAGCVIANLARSGISIDGSNNTVRSCDLYNLGTGGISLNGGDLKSLTSANNRAINNHIHHYGLFQRSYAPGIGVHGCGQIVTNNCIHDAPHNAIQYGGNEHRFERNEIYRVVMETGDSGAFYTGRNWTSQGNELRHNYIHDLGGGDSTHVNTMGVYLDDCDSGDTIEGNVFLRAGRAIMIGGGRDNRVLNNLVIDCPIGMHLDSRGMTWKQWNSPTDTSWQLERKAKEMNYQEPPWSERYPRLAKIMDDSPREPLHNEFKRNVFVNCAKQVWNFDANVKKVLGKLVVNDNLAVNTVGAAEGIAMAPDINGFQNVAGSDQEPIVIGFATEDGTELTQIKDARVRNAVPSFQPIPFDTIGLIKDSYRRVIP